MGREASTPEEALRILEDGVAVYLLVVDYAMPGINGLELIWQAWRKRPSLKTLLIAGDGAAVGSDVAGAPLLRKPFRPAGFSDTVATILADKSVAAG